MKQRETFSVDFPYLTEAVKDFASRPDIVCDNVRAYCVETAAVEAMSIIKSRHVIKASGLFEVAFVTCSNGERARLHKSMSGEHFLFERWV